MNAKAKQKLGPVIPWDAQPAARPPRTVGEQRQLQSYHRFGELISDSVRSSIPPGYEVIGDGCYHTTRKPGAE